MCLKEKEIPRAEIQKKIKGKHKNLAHFQQIPIGINAVLIKTIPLLLQLSGEWGWF